MNEFQYDGTDSGLLEGMGITEESFAFGGGFSLDVVAAFLNHTLGEHAEVADHGNTISQDGLHHGKAFEAAFDFNGNGACISKKSSILEGERWGRAAAGRKIACDEGFLGTTSDGTCMMKHVRHGDLGGIGVAEYDHSQGIADEEKIETTVIKKSRGWIIIGREAGETATDGFGIAQTSGSIFQGAENLEVMKWFWQILWRKSRRLKVVALLPNRDAFPWENAVGAGVEQRKQNKWTLENPRMWKL